MFTRTTSYAFCMALLSLLLCFPAQAQKIEIGTGVFCNTQKQMERFVALFDGGDEETAINSVNAEQNDPGACGSRTIAYVRGAAITTTRTSTWKFHIVRVLVVGVFTPAGFQVAVPSASFSVEQIEERAA